MLKTQRAQLLVLLICCSALFLLSKNLRTPFRTTLSTHAHQIVTAQTLSGLRSWYVEGPWNLKWASVLSPRSIENSQFADRAVYSSYPVGYLVPPFLLCKVFNFAPTDHFLSGFLLFQQLLVGIILSLTVYRLLQPTKLAPLWLLTYSSLPCLLLFFWSGTMYWFQALYFPDVLILLPFSLLIFLESLPDKFKTTRFHVLLAGILFWGCSTDYLFYFVAAGLLAKRLLLNPLTAKRRKAWGLWTLQILAAPTVALTLFVIQLAHIGQLRALYERFLFRTGLHTSTEAAAPISYGMLSERFWLNYVPTDYGFVGALALGAALLAGIFLLQKTFRRSKKLTPPQALGASLFLIVLLPCLLEIYVLKNHSYIHSFSVLKFALPLILLLSLSPLFFPALRLKAQRLAVGALAIMAYTYSQHTHFTDRFPAPDPVAPQWATFINSTMHFEDVVFSKSVSVRAGNLYDSVLIAYAPKEVYTVKDYAEIPAFLAARKVENATIKILEPTQVIRKSSADFEIISTNFKVEEYGDFAVASIAQKNLRPSVRTLTSP